MDSSLPITPEPREGQSPPSRGMHLSPRFTGCKTVGEMLRRLELDTMERTRNTLPPEVHEKLWPPILKRYEEWPDWVLRIAAEVVHVQFPTIAKETILDVFRCVNFFVFVARIDDGPIQPPPKFPDVSPQNLGAMAGHAVALVLNLKQDIEILRKLFSIESFAKQYDPASREELRKKMDDMSSQVSFEDFQSRMALHVADYFKARPGAFIEFQTAFIDAQRSTYDKNGRLKETPLTPIYRKILSEWPEIESLSGPKALTDYLSPLLGNQEIEAKYDRVKMICSRFQIKFLPSVK